MDREGDNGKKDWMGAITREVLDSYTGIESDVSANFKLDFNSSGSDSIALEACHFLLQKIFQLEAYLIV